MFLYITYVVIIVIQVALFHTDGGCGSGRSASIRPQPTRWASVCCGPATATSSSAACIAGIGGAYLTIGSVGSFNPDISSGFGYIALAALIFGRWTPLGSLAAALLFGFCLELALVLPTVNSALPPPIMNMAPYVVTIIAVAGLVGKVRAPKADGEPYVKA